MLDRLELIFKEKGRGADHKVVWTLPALHSHVRFPPCPPIGARLRSPSLATVKGMEGTRPGPTAETGVL